MARFLTRLASGPQSSDSWSRNDSANEFFSQPAADTQASIERLARMRSLDARERRSHSRRLSIESPKNAVATHHDERESSDAMSAEIVDPITLVKLARSSSGPGRGSFRQRIASTMLSVHEGLRRRASSFSLVTTRSSSSPRGSGTARSTSFSHGSGAALSSSPPRGAGTPRSPPLAHASTFTWGSSPECSPKRDAKQGGWSQTLHHHPRTLNPEP